ncbi:MFS transporter [Lysinibacillus odysseyi]|uniref:Multidrug transporter n=1 Tax=Lysinibacillus odysseyi 34hs-1 = NBRC 100172 TaxID=1220589 RepID=A0A0A3IDP8_9BACI|nr:MFS transporter [Lysinibacillus odysseyi]KGR82886.1 multidrug transporter [Lysinibacillus odysseyi 34hs-1 = NBRC 100172]
MECVSVKKWLQLVKSYNYNIRTFIIANILIQIGMGVFSVMYNLYIRELGLPEAVNGSVISINSLATAIMLVPAGILSDKFGRKWILITGTALTAIMLFGRSIVTAEQPMLILGFATGIVWALTQVSGVPFLAENSRPSERMQLFSIHFALVTVANVIGSLLGGVIADFALMVGAGDVASIQISLLTGVLCFVAGLLPLFSLKTTKAAEMEDEEREQNEEIQTVADFRSNLKVIVLFSIANLIIGTGSGLVIPYLNLYFANRFDATNSYIGFILALGSAMTAVAMLIGPRLVKRVGKVKALVIFQIASIPFLFLTAYTGSLLLASIGFLLRQALMNAGNPIQSAIAMDVVHHKYKGLANSVNQMVFNIGWATMGLPAAWLVTEYGAYWGYAIAFSITGGLYLIASTYFYLMFGRRYKPVKQAGGKVAL